MQRSSETTGQQSQGVSGPELADALGQRCQAFLHPFLEDVDDRIDRRLVRTAGATITALVRHRDRSQALLLSELGAYLASPDHAPAGTKRLANLVRSPRWSAEVIPSAASGLKMWGVPMSSKATGRM